MQVAKCLNAVAVVAVVVAVFMALGSPDGAEAKATLTLGSSLPETNAGLSCSCTLVEATGASPSESFVSPVDGVITRWRVRNSSYGPGADLSLGFALRVLRSNGAASYTGMGTSALGRPQSRGIETFPAHLPIRAGEYVAIDDPNNLYLGYQSATGLPFGELKPPIADGSTASAVAASGNAMEFNVDVLPSPTIALLAPSGGTAPEQTTIGILGTNFEEVEAVTIGGKPANYSVQSESLITATLSAGLSPGQLAVAVTTPAGTASSTFAYGAPSASAPTSTPPSSPPPPQVSPRCIVPKLSGRTLKASKRQIRAADCKVGALTKRQGATARTGEVVKQSPQPGASVPAGTKVKVTLGQG